MELTDLITQEMLGCYPGVHESDNQYDTTDCPA
jgi:hypothetical protein